MVSYSQPNQTHVITKEGECHLTITLDLNLNITSDGLVTATAKQNKINKYVDNSDDDEVHFTVPDFKSEKGKKLDFGKKIKSDNKKEV